MSKPSDLCSFVAQSKKIIDSKSSAYDLVLLENSCLRAELSSVSEELENRLAEQAKTINQLSNKVENLDGGVNNFKATQDTRFNEFKEYQTGQISTLKGDMTASFETYKNTQAQVIEQHNTTFEASLSHYESSTATITTILAIVSILVGAGAFAFVKMYKGREINEMIDEAKAKAENKLNDSDLVKSAVVNACNSDAVMDNLKLELLDSQEAMIREIIQDMNLQSNDDNENLQDFLSNGEDDA